MQLHQFTPLTYESASARLFAEGRTETYRVVTKESVAFVRAMCDDSVKVLVCYVHHSAPHGIWHLALSERRACHYCVPPAIGTRTATG